MTPRELIEILQAMPGAALDAQIAGSQSFDPTYERGVVCLEQSDDDEDDFDEDGDE